MKTTAQSKTATVPTDNTSAENFDHAALRIWLKLLTCHNLIESHLRGKLRTQFDTTLPRFDLMAQLDRHPEGLRMQELSRRLMVTGGNLTGLTDRLVEDGLIERRDDPSDRRAYFIHLTPAGKSAFQRIASEHEHWVIDLFSEFDTEELAQLAGLLGKLRQHLA